MSNIINSSILISLTGLLIEILHIYYKWAKPPKPIHLDTIAAVSILFSVATSFIILSISCLILGIINRPNYKRSVRSGVIVPNKWVENTTGNKTTPTSRVALTIQISQARQ